MAGPWASPDIVETGRKLREGSVLPSDDALFKKIEAARTAIYFHFTFFANILIGMPIIDATSWCKTFATDGLTIYVNRDWALKLTIGQLMFVLIHETFHVIFRHVGRSTPEMDFDLFNVACDYIINWIIVEEMARDEPTLGLQMPPLGCLSRDFTSKMYPEEVYDLLVEEKHKYAHVTTLDEHLRVTVQAGGGPDDEDKTTQGDSSEVRPSIDSAQLEEINQIVRDKLFSAAMIEKNAGRDIHRSVSHVIRELLDPKIPWKEMLEAFVNSQMKGRRTFMKPSRRSMALRAAGHGYIALATRQRAKTVSLHAFHDASGSMTQPMLRDIHSEVVGISRLWKNADITLGTFDDHVYNVIHYDNTNIDDIAEYPFPEKGGGTNLPSVFSYLKRHEIVPERLIIFTDGKVFDMWGDPDYCPTLFVIHSDRRHTIVPPYGDVAYYDELLE